MVAERRAGGSSPLGQLLALSRQFSTACSSSHSHHGPHPHHALGPAQTRQRCRLTGCFPPFPESSSLSRSSFPRDSFTSPAIATRRPAPCRQRSTSPNGRLASMSPPLVSPVARVKSGYVGGLPLSDIVIPMPTDLIQCDGATPHCHNCERKGKDCKYQHGDDKRKYVRLQRSFPPSSHRIVECCALHLSPRPSSFWRSRPSAQRNRSSHSLQKPG